jgi:hypothetical protein
MRMLVTKVVPVVPSSPEEFIRDYRDYVVSLVKRFGIPAQEAEDVANDILLRQLQLDILHMYNPDHAVTHQGVTKKVTFRAFLSARVSLYCRGKRDVLQRRAGRELLICDTAVDESGTSWLDVFGGAEWDDYSHLDAEEFLTRMRSHLARVPRRSLADSCDLVALFDELVREVRENGGISTDAVRTRFGISDTTATAWIGRLRRIMGSAGRELPPPESYEVGGLQLTPAEIREAVEALRKAKGIMVRQPLASAGHRLASAPDAKWYLPFAKEEIKAFPELEIDPQTHKKPAGHVKLAVLHRLERMLGLVEVSAPAAPPEEPVLGPVQIPEIIEARLWQCGVPPQDIKEILGMVEEYAGVRP